MGAMSGGNASATQGPVTQNPNYTGNQATVGGGSTTVNLGSTSNSVSPWIWVAVGFGGLILLVVLLRKR